MTANAWHHRSDALSSIPALVAVGGAILWPALAWLDPVGGLIVSLFILHAAWRILLPLIRELTDSGVPVGMVERIAAITLAIPEVRGVHRIRTRYLGNRIAVDMHVQLDDEMPLVQAHRIGHLVMDTLKREEPLIVDVIAHLDPVHDHPSDSPVVG